MATYDLSHIPELRDLQDLANRQKARYEALLKALENKGGQANVIETIKVNGQAQAVNAKAVDITVPGVDSATENVMYLVLNPKTKHYDIYAKIKGTNGSYTMEQLDDTTVDLSGYVQKENGKRLMTDAESAKLAGIAEGANKYTHPTYTARSSGLYKVTVDAYGHVTEVAPVTKEDITGLGIPGTNTTYSPMSGATSSAAGTNGLVPAPPAGAQGKFLRGDGTWQPLVSYGEATATNAGLMSAADKTKLDGLVLATSAEVKAMLDEVFAEA